MRQHTSTDPLHDQRGAVLLGALFAAMLLSGFVFFVVARGDAIEHRGRAQQAADTAALAGADAYANAMNVVAHINMGQLGATVRVTVELAAAAGSFKGAAAALALCFVNPAACKEGKALLKEGFGFLKAAASALAKLGPGVLAASRTQTALIGDVGGYADARVENTARVVSGVRSAFIAPALSLPLQQESVSKWCGRVPAHAAMRASTRVLKKGTGPFHLLASAAAGAAVAPACRLVASINGFRGYRLIDEAEMGSPYFQVPVYVLMSELSAAADRNLVRTARWGVDDPTTTRGFDSLRWKLAQLHVAQSEYYFDGSSSDPLFEQRWRARLRRFRPELLEPPYFALPGGVRSWFHDVCLRRFAGGATSSAACDDMDDLIVSLRPAIIH